MNFKKAISQCYWFFKKFQITNLRLFTESEWTFSAVFFSPFPPVIVLFPNIQRSLKDVQDIRIM
jgi:hypothetical protein